MFEKTSVHFRPSVTGSSGEETDPMALQRIGQGDGGEPVNFYIKVNNDSDIRGICAAQTFHIFIERHIELVYRMQRNNRFDYTILFDEKPKRSSQSSKFLIDGKQMWITHDHNTYWKMGIVQQIYWENPDMADRFLVVPLYSHFV